MGPPPDGRVESFRDQDIVDVEVPADAAARGEKEAPWAGAARADKEKEREVSVIERRVDGVGASERR